MNKKQATRLAKLATFLKTVREKEWDYSSIQKIVSVDLCTTIKNGEKKINKLTCNSTACALGWCPILFPKNFRSDILVKIDEVKKANDTEEVQDILDADINVSIKCENGWKACNCSLNDNEIAKFFGITEQEMLELFFNWEPKLLYGVEEMCQVKPKMITKYINTILSRYGYGDLCQN